MTDPSSNSAPIITGKHVLLAMILFFASVIAVNTVFVRLALASFPGEEVKKSYYQGLNYNEVLAEKARMRENGAHFQVAPIVADADTVSVTLLSADATPLSDFTVTGTLVRPTHSEGLQNLIFVDRGNGLYVASLAGSLDGAWDLKLNARQRPDAEIYTTAQTRVFVE